MGRLQKRLRLVTACVIVMNLCVIIARAEEDPAVTRAREIARQQYELEKATRLAEEAKKKLAEQLALQKAIAMTRQGVVSIYNPGNATNGYLPFSYAWRMWDGTLTEWASTTIADKKSLYFYKVGGIKLEVKFTSIAGGTRNGIARLTSAGSVDVNFTSGGPSGGLVTCLGIQTVQGIEYVLVGGTFNSFAGSARSCIARLTTTGVLDASSAASLASSSVWAMTIATGSPT